MDLLLENQLVILRLLQEKASWWSITPDTTEDLTSQIIKTELRLRDIAITEARDEAVGGLPCPPTS